MALAATWLGLRVMGYRGWKSLLGWSAEASDGPANPNDPAVIGSADAIARFEEAAARHLFVRTNCLERSLVLCWALRRRGIPAQMRVGARKHDGRFEAHAWVELNGSVLNDTLEHHRHFEPFAKPIGLLETETP